MRAKPFCIATANSAVLRGLNFGLTTSVTAPAITAAAVHIAMNNGL